MNSSPGPHITMPPSYDLLFEDLLALAGSRPGVEPAELAAFWPRVGHTYDREILVIGRAVNGWIHQVRVPDLASAAARQALVEEMREWTDGAGQPCPLSWVVGAWGRRVGDYSTARSAFWRLIRGVLAAVDPESIDDPAWSSRLAWTNLAKLAPWGGGNPGGALLDVQREVGPELIAAEVVAVDPRRVLVLTGRRWFEPFVIRLGLTVDWRDGLVEGVADEDGRRWVIAPHPQGKPRGLLPEVLAAFG